MKYDGLSFMTVLYDVEQYGPLLDVKRYEERIIKEEQLKTAETKKYISNAFRDGQLRTSGTDIDKILPAMSRFGGGGNRSNKKTSVIRRLKEFFEKYLGL